MFPRRQQVYIPTMNSPVEYKPLERLSRKKVVEKVDVLNSTWKRLSDALVASIQGEESVDNMSLKLCKIQYDEAISYFEKIYQDHGIRLLQKYPGDEEYTFIPGSESHFTEP